MTSVTLELDDRHGAVLEALSAEQGMSKAALLRQALRLYQLVHDRNKRGQNLAFVQNGRVVPLLIPSMSLLASPVPEECVATGQSCLYGPHGPHGEHQCRYCGSTP